jgi:hypothetical protein
VHLLWKVHRLARMKQDSRSHWPESATDTNHARAAFLRLGESLGEPETHPDDMCNDLGEDR